MREATDGIAPTTRPAGLSKDIGPRILSAAVMAVVAIGATWSGAGPFAALVAVIAVAMSWEWARIVRGTGIDSAFFVQALAVLAAVGLAAVGAVVPAVGAAFVGAVAVLAMGVPRQVRLSALGVLYVGLPAVALIWLRNSEPLGSLAILFIFAIVWTTDSFAYLCGRLIGGPKLWPALSPGKTWAGTIGGILFAWIAAITFARLVAPGSEPWALAAAGVAMSVVSQIGDLAESALKRAFAVKNASEIIPGHGGFMDRMDGVVAAALMAALVAASRSGQPSPAHALLIWS